MGFPRTLFLTIAENLPFYRKTPPGVSYKTRRAWFFHAEVFFRQFSAQKHLRVENPRGGVLSVFGVSQPHRAERDGIICFFLLMILDRNTQFFSSPVILNACRMVSVSPEYSR